MNEKDFQERLAGMINLYDDSFKNDEDREAHLLSWDEFMVECSEDQC